MPAMDDGRHNKNKSEVWARPVFETGASRNRMQSNPKRESYH
jgi:hypothetical protein